MRAERPTRLVDRTCQSSTGRGSARLDSSSDGTRLAPAAAVTGSGRRLGLASVALVAAAGCSLWIDGDHFSGPPPADADAAAGRGLEQDSAPDPMEPPDAGPDAGLDSGGETDAGETDAAPPACTDGCAGCESGCCTETCGGGNCRLACDAPACSCDLACAATAGRCDVTCAQAVCSIDCREVGDCTARCQDESDCAIDCTGAADCTKTDCIRGAGCLLDCTGAAGCSFRTCDGAITSCPGDVIACNRECP